MAEEWFDLVDEDGRVTGRALRSECHGNPALLHPVAHVLVTHPDGRLLLQKRAMTKDIQPGRWDSSVGGHLLPGEPPEAGARREMLEELGVLPRDLTFTYRYVWRTDVESELVHTYTTIHPGPFAPATDEIDEVRFWTPDQIQTRLGTGLFTPNLEHEFGLWRTSMV